MAGTALFTTVIIMAGSLGMDIITVCMMDMDINTDTAALLDIFLATGRVMGMVIMDGVNTGEDILGYTGVGDLMDTT
jgi:hypothetical protein